VLEQNYPNPFNPLTSIRFQITDPGLVTLRVYNMLGQEVITLVDENLKAGTYEASLDGAALSSGTYLYRLTSNGAAQTRKMVLLK
jgi:hypothetical protein